MTDFPESGLFLEEPALSPDGRSLAYARWKGGASLWLLRLGGAEDAAVRHSLPSCRARVCPPGRASLDA